MKSTVTFAALVASVLAAKSTDEGLIGLKKSQCEFSKEKAKEVTVMFVQEQVPNAHWLLDQIAMEVDDDQKFEWMNNSVFTGVNMETTETCIDLLKSMDFVKIVDEKTEVKSFGAQTTAPWGLQRVSSDAGASGRAQMQTFTYAFDDDNLGAGVDIYVIDTGVLTSHVVFGGRAVQGYSFDSSSGDGDGHGTHVAGTAAGAKFGIAQKANIIAVKVLGDDGSGSSSDTIAGMDWVINNHNQRKTQDGFVGSIMQMSWGLSGTAASVDEVITGAVAAGIHVSVAAGNDGADACTVTPAHLGGANSAVVTVGSVNIQNTVSSFSNIGKCVDVFAPGEEILSAWNTGNATVNFLSGTSMATPHNSGVMAYLMAQDTTLGQDPVALKAKLLSIAREGKIAGSLSGGANLLLSNGASGATKRSAEEKRMVTGSPAAWAKSLVNDFGSKRWQVESSDSPVRF